MKDKILELIKQNKRVAIVKYADGLAVYVFRADDGLYNDTCFLDNDGKLVDKQDDSLLLNSELPHILKALETNETVHTDDLWEHGHD